MIKGMVNSWSDFVVDQRWWVIVSAFFLAALLILPMKNLYYDNSRETYFVEGDPRLETFNLLHERFGDNEQILIGVSKREQDESVFAYETLKTIDKLHRFLEDHDSISKVTSLANFQHISAENESLETIDLIEDIDELEDSAVVRAEMKSIMADQPIALGRLITEDFNNTVILATVLEKPNDFTYKNELVQDLESFVQSEGFEESGFDLQILGAPKVEELFATTTSEDQAFLNPAMTIIMMICLFIFFRSVVGVMLPWVLVGLTVTMTFGIQGLLSWPFNAVVTALPPILIIICIGDAVHIISEFYLFRSQGNNPKDAAKKAVESLWLPCFYTSLTTAVGFIALSSTKLFPIQELGVLGAAASIIAFLLSVTLLPAILSFVDKLPKKVELGLNRGVITRSIQNIHSTVQKRRNVILFAGPVLIAFSIGFLSQISVDTNWANYFKDGHPIHADRQYFDEHFGGSDSINVMIDSGKEGGAKEPEFLNRVSKFQAYLEGLEGTGKANSYIDYIKQMNKTLNNNDPDYYVIPENKNQVAQFLLLYENSSPEEDLSDLKSFDERHVHMAIQVTNRDSSEVNNLVEGIYRIIDQDYSDLDVELTGGLIIQNAQDSYVNSGMITSFSLALFLVGICFIVLFRSFKYGLLALIPSVLPILFAGGILSMLNIPLDMGTMIVGAITLGIAVDDTIHFMSRYLKKFRSGASVHDAVGSAMTESGRPIVLTSIIVTLGFSVLILSQFLPMVYTGLFSAIIIIAALVCDLLLLPAFLYLVDGKKERKQEAVIESAAA